uniref:Uncharacterized protein n=1 Tax=Rhizophora mucronata TaxID=61149 RepID=A0A2P2KE87_RHIMU
MDALVLILLMTEILVLCNPFGR